jgi:hypothetical protein
MTRPDWDREGPSKHCARVDPGHGRIFNGVSPVEIVADDRPRAAAAAHASPSSLSS